MVEQLGGRGDIGMAVRKESMDRTGLRVAGRCGIRLVLHRISQQGEQLEVTVRKALDTRPERTDEHVVELHSDATLSTVFLIAPRLRSLYVSNASCVARAAADTKAGSCASVLAEMPSTRSMSKFSARPSSAIQVSCRRRKGSPTAFSRSSWAAPPRRPVSRRARPWRRHSPSRDRSASVMVRSPSSSWSLL